VRQLRGRRIRLITLDRPGFGNSAVSQAGTLRGFAGVMSAHSNQLDPGRFAVVGSSAGGPAVLAIAIELAASVISEDLVCARGARKSQIRGVAATTDWPAYA
jgi:pimeloyl-ACP methyl ester carboxylesterase